jgi:hypothetical protein
MERQANATEMAIEDRPSAGQRRQVTVRRRRPRKGARRDDRWIVARSRTRIFRTAAVCTGVLLLMALSLYFGLSRQEAAPGGEGATRGGVVGVRGIV